MYTSNDRKHTSECVPCLSDRRTDRRLHSADFSGAQGGMTAFERER